MPGAKRTFEPSLIKAPHRCNLKRIKKSCQLYLTTLLFLWSALCRNSSQLRVELATIMKWHLGTEGSERKVKLPMTETKFFSGVGGEGGGWTVQHPARKKTKALCKWFDF